MLNRFITNFYFLFADFLQEIVKFYCEVCYKSYKHKNNLSRHRKYECRNIRNFKCPICSHMFIHKHHLAKHLESCK